MPAPYMDPLVKVALLGTAQSPESPGFEPDLDALVAAAGPADREQALLFLAGAAAIMGLAGQRVDLQPAGEEAAPLGPCPPDDLRPCSSAMTEILRSMLSGEQRDLLPLALVEMRGQSLALPHELLPEALACPEDQRPLLRPLLGARGRWLAAHNPAWSWALGEALGSDDPPPVDFQRIFEEGEPQERRRVLRQLRRHRPDDARALLGACWAGEKAEHRRSFLAIIAVGLGAADEPFLAAALADRSAAVRGKAAELLRRLPDSAYARRMIARATPLVRLQALGVAERLKAAVSGQSPPGKLQVALPDAFDPAWADDAVIEAPPAGVGRKAWWLTQLIAGAPPATWEAHLGASPAAIVTCLRGHDLALHLADGLTAAALAHDARAWMGPLWDLWRALGKGGALTARPQAALIAAMDPGDAERRICALLGDGTLLLELMEALPAPWSDAVAAAYLRGLGEWLRRLDKRRPQSDDPWLASLRAAGRALPSAAMEEALALPAPPEGPGDWYRDKWRSAHRSFTEAIRLRQRLAQEMRT